jgi:type IV secretion system protein VirB9
MKKTILAMALSVLFFDAANAATEVPAICQPATPCSAPAATPATPATPKEKIKVVHKKRKEKVLNVIDYGTDTSMEARNWQYGGNAKPVMGTDGLLQYPFGQGQPDIACAPLRACDIQLQAGETINNVILGDTVRWLAAPAKTGEGATASPHVIIKPTEPDLNTNLVITTNLRTYMLSLHSTDETYTSRVGFYYPGEMVQNWNLTAENKAKKNKEESDRNISDLPISSLDQLHLDSYRVKGNAHLAWYPTRVFDDGTHVYIQMPDSMNSSDSPALVLIDRSDKTQLVNYRVKKQHRAAGSMAGWLR